MFDPRLEDAAEAELFRERDEPEHAQEKSGDLPDWLGPDIVSGVEQPGEGSADQEEIEIVDGAGSPLFAIGDESVAGFVNAALKHQRHDGDHNQRDVAQQNEVPEILELELERRIH